MSWHLTTLLNSLLRFLYLGTKIKKKNKKTIFYILNFPEMQQVMEEVLNTDITNQGNTTELHQERIPEEFFSP